MRCRRAFSTGTTYYLRTGSAGLWRPSLGPAAGPISPWVCRDGHAHRHAVAGGQYQPASPAAAWGDRFQRRHGTHTATRKRTANETFSPPRRTARPSHSRARVNGRRTPSPCGPSAQVGTQTPFLPAADGGRCFATKPPLPRTRRMPLPMTRYGAGGVTDYPERPVCVRSEHGG